MGHPQIIAAALSLTLALSGCANLRWSLQRSFRDPGERIETFPEIVWDEYACDGSKLPFFELETNELIPPQLKAGSRFNHRMVYVLCPVRPTAVVTGRLVTRIRFRGDPIVQERTEAYEIKPGRWVVDSEITLPSAAEPGVYAYEVEFRGDGLRFTKSLTFVVGR
ncbi:MAG: hypothetical protein JRH16_03135 [Deltaproteobacteria bacterium]|nr:hypothetical protein [Deltaproteobacteria bacterium]MBW2360286.1 hypothetical protein [Deltaproteobacteria bacterium]